MVARNSKSNRFVPWRFALFFGLLAVSLVTALSRLGLSQSLLIAFDVAALAFLISHVPTFAYDAKQMRAVAAKNDANRVVLLIISFLLSVVILAAIVGELSRGNLEPLDKALVTVSLILVWTFANAAYTLHYAHLFYTAADGGRDHAGMEFPKMREPLMADFAYFSFTLGVALQTSDVAVTSPHIRKVVTAHCVAGFFFNLGVLALTLNILGSR